MLQYIVLDDQAFKDEYHKAFDRVELANDVAQEQFRELVFEIQGRIVEALKSLWTEGEDFQVGWDFNYCRHACGGICSESIFCKRYVEAIVTAIASVDQGADWTYHTVCEIVVNPAGATAEEASEDRGEFFIRGNTCYIHRAMKRAHRQRLGSEA